MSCGTSNSLYNNYFLPSNAAQFRGAKGSREKTDMGERELGIKLYLSELMPGKFGETPTNKDGTFKSPVLSLPSFFKTLN
jgi:hypothetical protein